MTIYSLDILLFLFGTSLLFHVQFCCFLTCIQISQEAGQVVWYSHLLKNFPQFIVIHKVKGFGIVNTYPQKTAKWEIFVQITPPPNFPVMPSVSWLPTFAFQSPIIKRTYFGVLVLKGLADLHRTVQLQLLQCYWLGQRLGCDIEWFALEMNRDYTLFKIRKWRHKEAAICLRSHSQ